MVEASKETWNHSAGFRIDFFLRYIGNQWTKLTYPRKIQGIRENSQII